MRYPVALFVLVAALAAAPAATSGGWATVVLADLPTGTDAGETWTARMTILRHGTTPTDGATPSVTIVDQETSAAATFLAEPAGETGVYTAAVVFPDAGTWTYEIDNGLAATGHGVSETTTYPPVAVGGSGAGGLGDDGLPVLPFAGLGLFLVLGVATAYGVRRQRRLTPAS